MVRLLMQREYQGFMGVVPFEAESVEVAKATLNQAIRDMVKIQGDHKELMHRETAYLRELRAQMRHYAPDEISQDLKDKIVAEQNRTSTINFPDPSTKFEFYGLTLELSDFEWSTEGDHGLVYCPEIVTVDDYFANYSSITA